MILRNHPDSATLIRIASRIGPVLDQVEPILRSQKPDLAAVVAIANQLQELKEQAPFVSALRDSLAGVIDAAKFFRKSKAMQRRAWSWLLTVVSGIEIQAGGPLRWATMKRLEPCLADIEREAIAIRERTSPHHRDHAYVALKQKLTRFVGWDAEHPLLATCEAYDVGIKSLCDALDY